MGEQGGVRFAAEGRRLAKEREEHLRIDLQSGRYDVHTLWRQDPRLLPQIHVHSHTEVEGSIIHEQGELVRWPGE